MLNIPAPYGGDGTPAACRTARWAADGRGCPRSSARQTSRRSTSIVRKRRRKRAVGHGVAPAGGVADTEYVGVAVFTAHHRLTICAIRTEACARCSE